MIESRVAWTADDALLYAVAVGAGAEDDAELAFATENSEQAPQRVLPAFATVVAQRAERPAVAQLDLARAVHAGQSVRLERPLPVTGDVTLRAAVAGVEEKSAGVLISYETEIVGIGATASQVLIRDPARAPRPRRAAPAQAERPPDHVVRYRTARNQALLYRLCGDRNPLHSDPAAARRAGFERPILHGLCSFGYACRALVSRVCGGDHERFGAMEGRFAGPVVPGDPLDVAIWTEGDGARFRVTTTGGAPVIERGAFGPRS